VLTEGVRHSLFYLKGLIYVLERLRKPTIVMGLLGAVKLAAGAFGYDIISDEQINAIANGVSAIAAIIATLMNRDAVK